MKWAALGAAGAAAAAVGLIRSSYERKHFAVEETEVSSPKIKKARTFVFLSGLQDNEFGAGNEALLEAIG